MFVSLISITFSAYLLVKSYTKESTEYLKENIVSHIRTTYALLEAFSEQPELKDTSLPILDRVMSLKAYAGAFQF